MSVTISGTDEVKRILNEIAPKHARNLMRATVQGVAVTIANDAKTRAPVDTGTLRKAIKAKREKSPADNPTSAVYVTHGDGAKNDAWYWHFIEYGTSGKNPLPERPFIRPAIDFAKSRLNEIMVSEFTKKLDKLLAKELRRRLQRGL